MTAKTIEFKHIMDDNAGGYYDQHVYITYRIANMVVRNIIRKRTCNSSCWISSLSPIIPPVKDIIVISFQFRTTILFDFRISPTVRRVRLARSCYRTIVATVNLARRCRCHNLSKHHHRLTNEMRRYDPAPHDSAENDSAPNDSSPND